MRRSRWTRLFAVVAVVALVGAACGDDEDEKAETTDETTADDAGGGDEGGDDFDGVTLTATEYEFDAPDEMHASTINVRATNDGDVAHEFAFAKIDDADPDEFFEEMSAFVAADFSGPLPAAFLEGGLIGPGIGETQPGEKIEAEMSMSEGTWVLFCALNDGDTDSGEEEGEEGGGGSAEGDTQGQADEETTTTAGEEEGGEDGPSLPPHFEAGMFKVIEVTGDPEPSAPEAEATITVVDYGFEGLDDLTADTKTFAGVSSPDNEQLHHIVAFDFGEGTDPEEAKTQFAELLAGEGGGEEEGGGADEEAPPGRAQGGEPEEVGGTFPMSPGYGTTFDLKLTSGHTYLFACFLSDAEGGPPHAIAHDMLEAIALD